MAEVYMVLETGLNWAELLEASGRKGGEIIGVGVVGWWWWSRS